MSASERRWKRVRVDMRVKLRGCEEADATGAVVRTYEMSEGGMSVYAPDGLEIGAAVVVAFSLPPLDKPVVLRAVVRNRRGFRCGMEFLEMGPEERFEIVRYLGSLADAAGSEAAGSGGSET